MDEFYSENLVWGTNSKDNAEPVRVEKAFPAIVTKAQFSRVNKLMRSRAPKKSHLRRVGSTYLLSGLVKCKTCNRALSGQDTKSGQFAYYVCQSIMKRGKDACDTPRLNARRFEELVVEKVTKNTPAKAPSGETLGGWQGVVIAHDQSHVSVIIIVIT